jgi:iron(III) transport system ATP-binding protein
MPEISVSGLTKSFGRSRVLDDVTFTVADKEFVTLLGPSGCGKSTTLMCIAGFQRPDAGSIVCGDEEFFAGGTRMNLAPERRNLGLAFQSYAVWPHMTVFDNIAFPLKVRKLARAEVHRLVGKTLELVELTAQTGRYPHELSGGQQQRVALARALVYSPSVLLLDEPFSNLDAKLRERARSWLKDLQRSLGLTTIFVTHDQHEALGMSDRVLVLDQGVVQQTGTPEDIYRRPANRFVADFVGHCNFLPATVTTVGAANHVTVRVRDTDAHLHLDCDGVFPVGASITIAVRPEAIELSSREHPRGATNTSTVDVHEVTFLGDHYENHVVLGPLELVVQTTRPAGPGPVSMHIPPGECAVVDG